MSRRIVIEMQGVDKRRLAEVWARMRQGEKLVGDDTYLGRSMADHPEWFPIFETMDVLGGDDRQPSGEDPFEHLTFHLIVGSQIFHRSPDEAESIRLLTAHRAEVETVTLPARAPSPPPGAWWWG